MICFLALSCFAQIPAGTNNVKSQVSNRWLLIVETSAAMQSRADAVHRIVAALLVSGMNGQMQPGDTVGVWTYNRDLYTGQFPLQVWTPSTSREVAGRAHEFLNKQKYGNEGRFEKVLPGIQRVVTNSEFITVVLISAGAQKIQGTPYDERINSYYATWQNQQQKAAAPFVTMLRAVRGQFTSYTVTTPPWPLEMPAVSPQLIAARTPPKPVEPPKSAPPVYAAPLIISGRKTEPETQSASTMATINQDETPTSPSASPVKAAQPADPPPANSSALTPESLVVSKGTQSFTSANPPPINTEPKQTIAAVEQQSSSSSSVQSSSPPTRPEQKTVSATTSTKAIVTHIESEPTAPASIDVASLSKADPDAQTAVIGQAGNFLASRVAWITGAVLLAVGFALVLLLARHSRSSSHASLITRSLDREQK